jgi:hypothetical protein
LRPSPARFSRSTFVSLFAVVALAACDGGPSPFDAVAPGSTSPGGPSDGGTSDGGPSDGIGGSCAPDACSASVNGIAWDCKERFMYGANWAWRAFGADFGGVAAWGNPGVAGNSAPFSDALRRMKADGVSVVRWWMFPRFFSDGITWGEGAPSGIRGSMVADVQRALELAEEHDVYIMLTPFSFDNFRPTTTEHGLHSRGIRPMIVDPALRRMLLENLLGPIADAVEQSPYRHRMVAWDIINEPEWAIAGASLTGDEAFPGGGGLESVSHAQMETFLKEATTLLHGRSSALVSVGGAAIKWARAWTRVGLDFYQLHYYDWVYEHYPYQQVTLASVGLTDKPTVMGEYPADGVSAFPAKGLPARSGAEFAADMLEHGYAGALSWAFNDAAFPWDATASRTFTAQRGCEVSF